MIHLVADWPDVFTRSGMKLFNYTSNNITVLLPDLHLQVSLAHQSLHTCIWFKLLRCITCICTTLFVCSLYSCSVLHHVTHESHRTLLKAASPLGVQE